MARALVPGLIVTPRTVMRKVRELPVFGTLLVKPGDRVTSDQIVARAELPGEMYILRPAERLGLEPHEVMEKLEIKEGDQIEEGQLLFQHSGLFGIFKSEFRSPASGTVEFVTERTAHVGLRLAPDLIQLEAYIAGTVSGVREGRSVTIETEAAFLQGIFGVGGERRGKLMLLEVAPDSRITEADIPPDTTGMVLVGGAGITSEALDRAALQGTIGVVTGAIDDAVLTQYLGYTLGIALTGDEDVPMTLVVTEGFGQIAIADRILDVLREFEGREVSVNGATQVRAGAVRPEIIVCHSDHQPAQLSRFDLSQGIDVGSSIRIIRYPYFGLRGRVTAMPAEAQVIETGAHARVLVAQLENGEEVTVPRANVELV